MNFNSINIVRLRINFSRMGFDALVSCFFLFFFGLLFYKRDAENFIE